MKIVLSNRYGAGFEGSGLFTNYLRETVIEDLTEEDLNRKNLKDYVQDEMESYKNSLSINEWRTVPELVSLAEKDKTMRVFDIPEGATDYRVVDYDGSETLYMCIDGKIVTDIEFERERTKNTLSQKGISIE